jgi:hypothetical protein
MKFTPTVVFLIAAALAVQLSSASEVGCRQTTACPCPKNMATICDDSGRHYDNGCIFNCIKKNCNGEERKTSKQEIAFYHNILGFNFKLS